MSRCRSIAAAVVVLGLAGLLIVGPTASATAASSTVPATPGGDFVPSGNKARQYIINTLGSVLKGQELIENSRVRSAVNDITGIRAATFGYLDRYKATPGDDTTARVTSRSSGPKGV